MSTRQTPPKRREPHPLYAAAPEAHRWKGGSLPVLFLSLRRQAIAREWNSTACDADKDFSWYVLPGGAVVGLRVREDLDRRLELRIARREKPESSAAQAKFESEVLTFLRQFEITPGDGITPSEAPGRVWDRMPITKPGDQGKAVARFIELRHGEVSPGKALCYVCLCDHATKTVVSWWPVGGLRGQRCDTHVGKDPVEARDR